MSRVKRQREALLSGFDKTELTLGPQNVPQVVELSVGGIGAPMDRAGTLRNAPMPFLSVWAGFRPEVDFTMPGAGGVTTWFEAGLIPYQANSQIRPASRQIRPLFSPLNGINQGPYADQLGMHALVPWPAGKLLVRLTIEYTNPNPLGLVIDACVAWAVCSVAQYPSLPAIQDLRDL